MKQLSDALSDLVTEQKAPSLPTAIAEQAGVGIVGQALLSPDLHPSGVQCDDESAGTWKRYGEDRMSHFSAMW